MNSQSKPHPGKLQLLRTKLFPAESAGRPLLAREALLDRLFKAREQRLILLSAPAGFGKSTVP